MSELTQPAAGAPTLLGDLARRLPGLTRRLGAAHGALVLRTRGQFLGYWFGAPILLLETRGRRTGKPRTTPLVYLPHGDGFAVVPANAGADRAPAWWLNLQAQPDVTVELKGATRAVHARAAGPGERQRLWARWAELDKGLDAYAARRSRETVVVILEPQ
jgi:deazaflavin-dependent oxidoreductase (nitroreductase family)